MLWGEEPNAEGKKKSLRLFNTLSRGGGVIQSDFLPLLPKKKKKEIPYIIAWQNQFLLYWITPSQNLLDDCEPTKEGQKIPTICTCQLAKKI